MSMVVDIHKKNGIRPEFDEYIGRKVRNTEFTKDSIWANPYLTLEEYDPYIRTMIRENPKIYNLEELRGKKIGCWCITTDKLKPLVCHGQILMKLLQETKS